MGNVNRKTTKAELAHLRRVVEEAFPGCHAVIGGHGDYGGHRSPRVRTISFRLQDASGHFRSNVVWVLPDQIGHLTAADVRTLVDRSNARRR